MIGQAVTLVRVKQERDAATGRPYLREFMVKGVIVDDTDDVEGTVTGIRIRGVRVWSGEQIDSWYAVGPGALNGSLFSDQRATVDACGCDVTDQCGCTVPKPVERLDGYGSNYRPWATGQMATTPLDLV